MSNVEQKIVYELISCRNQTIHQLQKKVGKSYGLVHKKVQQLEKEQVIFIETIGHSSVCRINWSNDQVMAYFISCAITHKIAKQNPIISTLEKSIPKINAGLKSIIVSNHNVIIVSDTFHHHSFKSLTHLPIHVMNSKEFASTYTYDQTQQTIIYGYEFIFRVMRGNNE